MYFFDVEIIEENTKLRFNDVLFWCEKIRLLHQVVIKLCCNLLIFVNTGAEIAEWCSPWILVVHSSSLVDSSRQLTSSSSLPFWNLLQNCYPNSYSFSLSPPSKRNSPYFCRPILNSWRQCVSIFLFLEHSPIAILSTLTGFS